MHASFCKVIWLAGAAQAKKNSSKNSETLDRQIALQVSGKRCIFDLGMKRLFTQMLRVSNTGNNNGTNRPTATQCALSEVSVLFTINSQSEGQQKSETSARLH